MREDCYGTDGAPLLAQALGLPAQAWRRYESGCGVPGEVVLAFIDLTHVHPHWLLTGQGQKYRREAAAALNPVGA